LIELTRLTKRKTEKIWVNENLIEFMEETPDTVLSMATGRKIVVAETAEAVAQMARENGCAIRASAAASSPKLMEPEDEEE
jgi:flagellar protein FlbD